MRGSWYKDKEGTKPWNGKSYNVERLTLIGGTLMRGLTVYKIDYMAFIDM